MGLRLVPLALVATLLGATGVADAHPVRWRLESVRVSPVVLVGTRVVAAGRIAGPRGRLQVRFETAGGRVLGSRRYARARAFTLRSRVVHRATRLRLRVLVVSRHRVVARSRLRRVRITPKPLVVPPSLVESLPASGSKGVVVLHARLPSKRNRGAHAAASCPVLPSAPKVGQVFATGYDRVHSPYGALLTILSLRPQGACTVSFGAASANATIEQALGSASGELDWSSLRQVAGASRGADKHVTFGRPIARGLKCSAGASASLSGSFAMNVAPDLGAKFTGLGGVSEAHFLLHGRVSAQVGAELHGAASCALASQSVLPGGKSIDIGTFAGSIGPVPVVVVLEADLRVDGTIRADADAKLNVEPSATLDMGVEYDHGRFTAVHTPQVQFPGAVPTIHGRAEAGLHVTASVRALLYHLAGPQVSLSTGLDFTADPSLSDWWTLSAPLNIHGSLVAPVLKLDKGDLNLYSGSFLVAHAGRPFGGTGAPGGGGGDIGDPLGDVHAIPVRTLPGAAWSYGLDDSGVPLATSDDGVLSVTCPSTASTKTEPLLVRLNQQGDVVWAAPVGLDHDSYGCPKVAFGQDGSTYVARLVELTDHTTFGVEAISPTGRVRWSHTFPNDAGAPVQADPAVAADGTVYFASRSGIPAYVDGWNGATGAHTVTIPAHYVVALTTWSGGVAIVDLDGNYRPVAKYFDRTGRLVHSYPVEDAVAANNATWGFSVDAGGSFLIAGAEDCPLPADQAKGHYAVEKVGPGGEQWLTTLAGMQLCGPSSVAPDTHGGAYLVTDHALDDGTVGETLTRLAADGSQWSLALNGGTRIGDVHVDANGVAVVATAHAYPCTSDSTTDDCHGSLLSFIAPSGAAARDAIPIEDPQYASYYQGIDQFTLGRGSVYVIRGSGDYHGETASVSRIPAAGVGSDYVASLTRQP